MFSLASVVHVPVQKPLQFHIRLKLLNKALYSPISSNLINLRITLCALGSLAFFQFLENGDY